MTAHITGIHGLIHFGFSDGMGSTIDSYQVRQPLIFCNQAVLYHSTASTRDALE